MSKPKSPAGTTRRSSPPPRASRHDEAARTALQTGRRPADKKRSATKRKLNGEEDRPLRSLRDK